MNALATRDSATDPTGVGVLPFPKPQNLGIEWDAEDRLIAVNQGTLRSEFTYDGLKRRVRMIEKVSGVVQSDKRVVWCKTAICEERQSDGTTVVRRAFAGGEQIGGAAQFFAKDHLGSVTEVTNSAGTLLARYTFDPWGQRILVAGSDVTTVGFTGHRWQQNGEIWLALHRANDSRSGRWLSEDASGFRDGYNLYAYVRNAPTNLSDPLGLAGQAPKSPQPPDEDPDNPDVPPGRSPPEDDYFLATFFCNQIENANSVPIWIDTGPDAHRQKREYKEWQDGVREDCSSEDAPEGRTRVPLFRNTSMMGVGLQFFAVCCEHDRPGGCS